MPEKPILTVSSPKDGRVLLDWNAVNGAEGYQIWRAESGTGNYAIAKTMKEGGITTYTNTGLAGGKVYDYKIRAYTEKGAVKLHSEDIRQCRAPGEMMLFSAERGK